MMLSYHIWPRRATADGDSMRSIPKTVFITDKMCGKFPYKVLLIRIIIDKFDIK